MLLPALGILCLSGLALLFSSLLLLAQRVPKDFEKHYGREELDRIQRHIKRHRSQLDLNEIRPDHRAIMRTPEIPPSDSRNDSTLDVQSPITLVPTTLGGRPVLVVEQLKAGSELSTAGLRVGDRIVRVNDEEPRTPLEAARAIGLLLAASSGAGISLAVVAEEETHRFIEITTEP
jgi:membrane-associated protease RseP (regulator of RpoE activity)